jgi:two-component system, chemotaxis family, CheB/CheR fusion protein
MTEKHQAGQSSGYWPASLDAEGIVDTVREPLIVLDDQLRVLQANRSFYRAFAVQAGEAHGRLLYDVGNGQWDIPRLRTLLEEILPQNATIEGFEVAHTFPSVGHRAMLFNARRIYKEVDKTEMILLAIEDVTERRRAEEARLESERKRTADLLQQAESFKEAERHKDEFLAMLAHELRIPLAPIRNALQIIQSGGPETQPLVQQSWEIIERQVENLVRLVDDLLDVNRISRGKIKLQKVPVDLAIIVARAIESCRPIIEGRRHHLEVSLPDGPMQMHADPIRMAQVLWNLLNNAAKYTPEGGRIWLTALREGSECAIRVRDTGMGIPPEMLPKVFDLFTQAERTLARGEGGLGIGLTLVRRLTEMHNGTVQASSAGPGEGSEFVVRLPLLPDSPAPANAEAHEPGKHQQAKAPAVMRRILVVDDNRDSADSFAMLLRLVGHDVRTVYDGRQALVVAATYRPDLVLLDIGLPGMDGFTVAGQMRAKPELAGVVLVALTGYGSEEDRRRSEAAGFSFHLVKPVHFDSLNELLTALEKQK